MLKLSEINPFYNFGAQNKVLLTTDSYKLAEQTIPEVVLASLEDEDLLISPFTVRTSIRAKRIADHSWRLLSGPELTMVNLELYGELEQKILGIKPKNIVLYGALESLYDIRPLLKSLRTYLISRPNSTLSLFPLNKSGLSGKVHRTWPQIEKLDELMESSGFITTKTNNGVIQASCTKKSLDRHLEVLNLPQSETKIILCTTEHPDYRVTGGIGSYIKEADLLYQNDSAVLIMDLDHKSGHNSDIIAKNRWFGMEELLGEPLIDYSYRNDHGTYDDALLEALYQIFFFYTPAIIECGDSEWPNAMRLIQAKNTGLLPADINIVTTSHAGKIPLANCNNTYPEYNVIPTAIREAYSIANSDTTFFLSNFTKQVYQSSGVTANNPRRKRIALDLSIFDQSKSNKNNFSNVENIIYIGKPTTIKGFDIFIKTILELDVETLKNLNIILLTTFIEPTEPECIQLLLDLKKKTKVQQFSLSRRDLITFLCERSNDSIAVISYPADNHPNALLEVIACGMDFVASKSGGIPELVNPKYSDSFLAEHNPKKLASKLLSSIGSRHSRQELVNNHKLWFFKTQKEINKSYSLQTLTATLGPTTRKMSSELLGNEVTVIIPCFNTEQRYIVALCESLNSQSVVPSEVIFIDDGSDIKGYAKSLRSWVNRSYEASARVVRMDKNRGLTAARNRGLNEATTTFIVCIDSDDLVTNKYIEEMLRSMKLNPDSTCTVSYNVMFKDGRKPSSLNKRSPQSRAITQNLATAFFPENIFGSAGAIFKRAELLRIGGWDESDRAMWEDWSLYIKLTTLGQKISVLPKINYLYRVRDGSMVRSYSKKDGESKLIKNYSSIPRLDSYLLFSLFFNLNNIYKGRYPQHMWDAIGAYHVEKYKDELTEKSRQKSLKKLSKRALVRLTNRLKR